MKKFAVALLAALTAFSCTPRAAAPNTGGIRCIGEGQADYWQARQDGRLTMLRTVAAVMADYENVPAGSRRDQFDALLVSVMRANPEIITLYTVWKPNAIDGMDLRYIGRPGSTPTGQYATAVSRETGAVTLRASTDYVGAMEYFNGPNSKKERALNPEQRTVQGKETWMLRFMVPIVNPRTNETVGGVGCHFDFADIQRGLVQALSKNEVIAAMAIYDNTGFIIASYIPERIGKNLRDVDTIYGGSLNDAFQSVQRGDYAQYSSYSQVLGKNVQIQLTPFQIGNSDRTWTVMIAAADGLIPFHRLFRK